MMITAIHSCIHFDGVIPPRIYMIIARASGNLRLAGLGETLMEDVKRRLIFDPYFVDAEQHTDILKQFINHDKSKAQDAMREHIENTKSRILAGF